MIAYDFDGVFIPDCDEIYIDGLDQTEFLSKVAYAMRPIFMPQQPYTVITSRHSDFTTLTMSWFLKHMGRNLPAAIYHSNANLAEPWLYKAEVINQLRLPIYIESSWETVEQLRVLTAANIIWFPQFVQQKLDTLKI